VTSVSGPYVDAVRELSLPDLVAPHLRVLICGLNPSVYSAERGVNFARPGNRFWPAALAAGLVSRDRDPWHALAVHRVGWTDLVKRATVGAASLTRAEYVDGVERLAGVVARRAPAVVVFVGVTGWRAAVDPGAEVGWQPEGFAGARAYVMPNTSGLNARVSHAEFVAHLQAAC
jgi:TDG/mug DNA glycosylase family protein